MLARRAAASRVLPPRVARFHIRAYARALRLDDDFALRSATAPRDVAALLDVARGHRNVVELGTATAWTSAALLLADGARHVTSFDPVVQEHREAYVMLLGAQARTRLTLVAAPGADGPRVAPSRDVDLLFVDSTHERAATVAEFSAWREHLVSGAVVVFHDHDNPDYPGVAEAVAELGLHGEHRGGMFVWRAPGATSPASAR